MSILKNADIENMAVSLFSKMQLVEPSSSIESKFNKKDYVYYSCHKRGTVPCVVEEVLNNKLLLDDGFEAFEADASRCELQD